jgi:hypothetical protein
MDMRAESGDDVHGMGIAQTNVQLYNQLRERRLPVAGLALVHAAYDLLSELYSGYYQADGKPFVAHGVGVASILASTGQPAEIIAVGLLHNAYGNADFGDGRRHVVTAYRRRIVRGAVGEEVERLLARFQEIRIGRTGIAEARRALPERSADERALLLVDLADYLEKYADMGVLYYGQNDWVLDTSDEIGEQLVAFAGALGHSGLGGELAAAIEEARAQDPAPAELRPADGRRYLKLVVPRSCRPRLAPRLHPGGERVRRALRPRTRLRHLRAAALTVLRG